MRPLLQQLACSSMRTMSLLSRHPSRAWLGAGHAACGAVPRQRQPQLQSGAQQANGALPAPACWPQQQSSSAVRWCSSSSSSRGRPLGPPARQQTVCSCSSQPAAGGAAEQQPPSSSGASTLLTLPTMLTLARVAAIPALIAAWFWQDPAATPLVTGLFVVASLTDWLDGYLARKMNLSSAFGAFLDPVADKLMVAAVLVLLSTQPLAAGPFAGNAWLMPVATLVIIGREITMSALREWAASMGPAAKAAVAVNAWGKWKTASQMAALTCLLLTRDGASGQLALAAAAAGPPLLLVASYLTAHSLAVYMAGLWKYMK